jgi:hypothetical protein
MKEMQQGWIASSMNKNDTISIIKKRGGKKSYFVSHRNGSGPGSIPGDAPDLQQVLSCCAAHAGYCGV